MRETIKVLKAVADRNRVRIIKMLEQRRMCVCELAAVLQIAQPSVSKHLRILKQAGLIQDVRNGPWTDYFLCPHAENRVASEMQQRIAAWLNDDGVIVEDRRVMQAQRREHLCARRPLKADEPGYRPKVIPAHG